MLKFIQNIFSKKKVLKEVDILDKEYIKYPLFLVFKKDYSETLKRGRVIIMYIDTYGKEKIDVIATPTKEAKHGIGRYNIVRYLKEDYIEPIGYAHILYHRPHLHKKIKQIFEICYRLKK